MQKHDKGQLVAVVNSSSSERVHMVMIYGAVDGNARLVDRALSQSCDSVNANIYMSTFKPQTDDCGRDRTESIL